MRLIDADALEQEIYTKAFMDDRGKQMKKWDGNCWIRYRFFRRCLKHAPTIEVETIKPVKIDAYGPHTWACGYCHNLVGTKLFRNSYCSHCGRKVKWNAIEAEPIQQGTWSTKWFDHKERIICSECECLADRMTDYCPNCGAKMRIEECD